MVTISFNYVNVILEKSINNLVTVLKTQQFKRELIKWSWKNLLSYAPNYEPKWKSLHSRKWKRESLKFIEFVWNFKFLKISNTNKGKSTKTRDQFLTRIFFNLKLLGLILIFFKGKVCIFVLNSNLFNRRTDRHLHLEPLLLLHKTFATRGELENMIFFCSRIFLFSTLHHFFPSQLRNNPERGEYFSFCAKPPSIPASFEQATGRTKDHQS